MTGRERERESGYSILYTLGCIQTQTLEIMKHLLEGCIYKTASSVVCSEGLNTPREGVDKYCLTFSILFFTECINGWLCLENLRFLMLDIKQTKHLLSHFCQ